MNRRSFLKSLGLGAAAVVAAPLIGTPTSALAKPATSPLFIPSTNLYFGVPRRILTATPEQLTWTNIYPSAPQMTRVEYIPSTMGTGSVQMTLIQAEYMPQFGGKLPAGSVLMVDLETANRWTLNGVAAPGPLAPLGMQEAYAKRQAERERLYDSLLKMEDRDLWWEGIPNLPTLDHAFRDIEDRWGDDVNDSRNWHPYSVNRGERPPEDSQDAISDLFRRQINRDRSAMGRGTPIEYDDAEFGVNVDDNWSEMAD